MLVYVFFLTDKANGAFFIKGQNSEQWICLLLPKTILINTILEERPSFQLVEFLKEMKVYV